MTVLSHAQSAPPSQGWLGLRLSPHETKTFHVWMLHPELAAPLFAAVGELAHASRVDWADAWLGALAEGLSADFQRFAESEMGFQGGSLLHVDSYGSSSRFYSPLEASSPRWASLAMPSRHRMPRFGPGKTLAWLDRRIRREFPSLLPVFGPFPNQAWDRLSQEDRAAFFKGLAGQAAAALEARDLSEHAEAAAPNRQLRSL